MSRPPTVLLVYFLLNVNQGGTSLGNTRLSADKGRGVLLETNTPWAPFFTSRILEATFYFQAED